MEPSLTPESDFELELDSYGRLVLIQPGGVRIAGVVPVRCFPLSAPSEHIALCDERGRELLLVRVLSELSREPRALIERELGRREFTPLIHRIRAISDGAEPTTWDVDTDRGPASFLFASEDHIRRLGDHGVLLSDASGLRYRIADERTLDARSQQLLRRYL